MAGAATGALAAVAGVSVTWHIIALVMAAFMVVLGLTALYLPDGAMSATDPREPDAPGVRRRALAAWAEPRTLMIGLMVLTAR